MVWDRPRRGARLARRAALRPVASVLEALPPLPAGWRALVDFAAGLLPARRGRAGAGGAAAGAAQARQHAAGAAAGPPAAQAAGAVGCRRPSERPMPTRCRARPCARAEQQAARWPRWQQAGAADAPLLLHGVTGSGKTEVYLRAAGGALRRAGRRWCWCPRSTSRRSSRRASPRVSGPRAGQPAQRPDAGAAPAPLAAGAPGPGRPGAGHAAGGVRVDAAAGADRGRRGARPLVQAAGRRALLGARPRGLARPPGGRAGAAGLGHALAGDLAARAGGPLPRADAGAAHRRRRDAARCACSTWARCRSEPGAPTGAGAGAAGGAIEQRMARGEQSLLLLNRRGYAPVLHCGACGWKSGCPHCSAWRVFHKADRTLRCHHCGFTERVPRACPDCGNLDIAPLGRGTEKLQEQLGDAAARARVGRIDADSTRARARWSSSWRPCTPARSTCWWARRWWPRGTTSAA
jgi:primosomal protein N' (replication factor Y) (superfamily II helicase)